MERAVSLSASVSLGNKVHPSLGRLPAETFFGSDLVALKIPLSTDPALLGVLSIRRALPDDEGCGVVVLTPVLAERASADLCLRRPSTKLQRGDGAAAAEVSLVADSGVEESPSFPDDEAVHADGPVGTPVDSVSG